jgi:hypothetical protein
MMRKTGVIMAGASQTSEARAQLYGLSAASVSSFTSVPDGSGMALLFDDFVVERKTADEPQKAARRSATFAASPAAQGRTLRLGIRGFHSGATEARLTVWSDGASQALTIPAAAQDVVLDATVRLSATGMHSRIELTAELGPPKEGEDPTALLVIDSIDAVLEHDGQPAR